MPRQIIITSGSVRAAATLNDGPTAQLIWEALPIKGRANTWGDEIYFDVPVFLESSGDAREAVAVGELGYWPNGNAFCIFFGPTPMSRGEEVRPASAVTVFGNIIGDSAVLRRAGTGAEIVIERKTA